MAGLGTNLVLLRGKGSTTRHQQVPQYRDRKFLVGMADLILTECTLTMKMALSIVVLLFNVIVFTSTLFSFSDYVDLLNYSGKISTY